MSTGRIPAITFTEKAATEIKERLVKRLAGDPEIRESIERAWVSTNDGFCTRLLQEHAEAASLDAVDLDESHQREAIVPPVEVVDAARGPVLKISACIPKDDQAAVGTEVDLHIAQIVERHVQRTSA